MVNLFKRWKPKGKMYSLRCFQCGSGFLSSYDLEAPICSKCLQKAKSLDSTIDNEKICGRCGKNGVIYGKQECHSCYFGFEKKKSSRQSSDLAEWEPTCLFIYIICFGIHFLYQQKFILGNECHKKCFATDCVFLTITEEIVKVTVCNNEYI